MYINKDTRINRININYTYTNIQTCKHTQIHKNGQMKVRDRQELQTDGQSNRHVSVQVTLSRYLSKKKDTSIQTQQTKHT